MSNAWLWLEWVASGLVTWSVVALPLVALGAFCDWMFQRKSASFRHSIWLATAVALVITPLNSICVPGFLPTPSYFSLKNPEPQGTTYDLNPSDIDESNASSRDDDFRRAIVRPGERSRQLPENDSDHLAGAAAIEPRGGETLEGKFDPSDLLKMVLVCSWGLGASVYLIRYGLIRTRLKRDFAFQTVAHPQLRKLVERLAKADGLDLHDPDCRPSFARWRGGIELTISKRELGPLIWGAMPARLLLPASLSQLTVDARESAIRHELAHVIRGDEYVRRFLLVLRTIFWFHPLVKHCCNQVQLFAEFACDDWVLQRGCQPVNYSELLLLLGKRRQENLVDLNASGMAQSQIGKRIRSILQVNRSRSQMNRPGQLAVVFAMILVTTAASALRPASHREGGGERNSQETQSKESNSQAKQEAVPKGWPQWGGTASRNNVTSSPKIPAIWNISEGKNVLWSAQLGSCSYGGTVVANGKVFSGTNNGANYINRFPTNTDLGVLLCFDEKDGRFLWQHSNRKLPTGRVHDWPEMGICSAPFVEGDRLWYVTNRGEVVCLDTEGFRDQENDGPYLSEESSAPNEADVVWVFDMMGQLKVSQHNLANCSVTSAGNLLFVGTSHGVEEDHNKIPGDAPPSFICLDRTTGKVIWTDSSPFPNILHGQWSSPAYGILGGTPQVIFAGGDGYLYGFAAEGEGGRSKLLWKFDCNPKESQYSLGSRATRNPIVATPVLYNGLVYVAVGDDPEHGEGEGHLWCIDPTKRGDVSPTLVFNPTSSNKPIPHKRWQALDAKAGDYQEVNPNSAAVWHYKGEDTKSFEQTMHRTVGTVVIKNNLLFIGDFSGVFHCVDARTGKALWTDDLLAAIWSSPLIVDDRVYIADEEGEVAIFKLSESKVLLQQIGHDFPIYTTPIVANDVLYLQGPNRIFAIQEGAKSKPHK